MSEFLTEQITLPSKGYFYPEDHPLSEGVVELRYPSAQDENILMSKKLIREKTVIDVFLQAILLTKFDYGDLLAGDRSGIMMAARIMAYGSKYMAKSTCGFCEEPNNLELDLNKLEAKEIDFDAYPKGSSVFKFKLPITKKDLEVKLLTYADSLAIDEEVLKMKKANFGREVEVTTRLKNLIVSVDGSNNKGEIRDFSNKMPTRDSLALRSFIRSITPDIDLSHSYTCAECGKTNDIIIPLDTEFFWPTKQL